MRFYLHLMRVGRVAYFILPQKLGEPCINIRVGHIKLVFIKMNFASPTPTPLPPQLCTDIAHVTFNLF